EEFQRHVRRITRRSPVAGRGPGGRGCIEEWLGDGTFRLITGDADSLADRLIRLGGRNRIDILRSDLCNSRRTEAEHSGFILDVHQIRRKQVLADFLPTPSLIGAGGPGQLHFPFLRFALVLRLADDRPGDVEVSLKDEWNDVLAADVEIDTLPAGPLHPGL